MLYTSRLLLPYPVLGQLPNSRQSGLTFNFPQWDFCPTSELRVNHRQTFHAWRCNIIEVWMCNGTERSLP